MCLSSCGPLSSSPEEGTFQGSLTQEPPSPAEWCGAEGRVGRVWERLRRDICQEPLTKGGGGVCVLAAIHRQFVSRAAEAGPKTGEQLEPHYD